MPADKHTLLSPELLTEIDTLLEVPHQQHVIEDNEITYPTKGYVWHLPLPNNNDEAIHTMDHRIDQVRHILGSQSLQAYKQIDSWMGLHKTLANTLVVFPGRSQYDIVRFAWNIPSGNSDVEACIVTLRRLHQTYGIDIIGAGYRTIEFRLQQQLTKRRRVRFLNRLLRFCPDIMQAFPNWESNKDPLVDNANTLVFKHDYFDISYGVLRYGGIEESDRGIDMAIFSAVLIGPILAILWYAFLGRSPANYNPRWVLATGVGSTIGTFFALRPHISLEATKVTFTEGVLSGIIYSLCYSIVTIVLLKWAVKGGRETTEW